MQTENPAGSNGPAGSIFFCRLRSVQIAERDGTGRWGESGEGVARLKIALDDGRQGLDGGGLGAAVVHEDDGAPRSTDALERVGRQPLRKLSAGDRLIKPLLGTLEYGLPHRNLVKGIAAAMHFRSEDDPQAQELAALIADKGPQAALAQISGLDAASDVVAEAVNDYNAEK